MQPDMQRAPVPDQHRHAMSGGCNHPDTYAYNHHVTPTPAARARHRGRTTAAVLIATRKAEQETAR